MTRLQRMYIIRKSKPHRMRVIRAWWTLLSGSVIPLNKIHPLVFKKFSFPTILTAKNVKKHIANMAEILKEQEKQ